MQLDRRVLGGLWALALVYLWRFVFRGWIPHDDGMLAQIAERVLHGELPHRDFDDPYTGLLGYVHGLGFLILGPSLQTLRLVLFAATAAWLPAMYLLARRFAAPPGAVLVAALALAWTVPNYFAGVPSYYNIFLATFGMLALARHLETGARAWTAVAGASAGLSFLVKSAGGVYFAVAAGLFLVYRERVTLGRIPLAPPADASLRSGARTALALAKFALAALIGVGLAMLSPALGMVEVLHFVAPGMLVALVIAWDERHTPPVGLAVRGRRLWQALWPLAAGFATPVALFLIPYILSGALGDFVQGVFVAPVSRFEVATFPLPPVATLWPALPYAAVLLFAGSRVQNAAGHWLVVALTAALATWLLIGSGSRSTYLIVWQSARHVGIAAVLAGCLLLARRAGDDTARQLLFLAIAAAAFMTLLQVPFAAPIYYAYTVPFVVLAVLAVAAAGGPRPARLHAVVASAYLVFALAWLNPSYLWALGKGYVPYRFVSTSYPPRAGIRMLAAERLEYATLIHLIDRTAPSAGILALPDCPEVYFLSGRPNPTRHLYEFLARPAMDARRVLSLVDQGDIAVVVINRHPHFSSPLDERLLADLADRYPFSAEAGRFLVRWRE